MKKLTLLVFITSILNLQNAYAQQINPVGTYKCFHEHYGYPKNMPNFENTLSMVRNFQLQVYPDGTAKSNGTSGYSLQESGIYTWKFENNVFTLTGKTVATALPDDIVPTEMWGTPIFSNEGMHMQAAFLNPNRIYQEVFSEDGAYTYNGRLICDRTMN